MGIQDTASQTELLLEWTRPFDPKVEIEADEPNDAARYGNAWHEGLALHAKMKSVKVKELIEKWAIEDLEDRAGLEKHIDSAWRHASDWFAEHDLKIVSVEEPRAMNPNDQKSRLVKFNPKTHTYELRAGEFGGTPDLVLEHRTLDLTVVWDYKSGSLASDFSDPKTAQLLSLLLLTGADEVAIMHFPRKSLPVVYYDRVSAVLRTEFINRRDIAMMRIGDGSLRPGAWCEQLFCPAQWNCPAAHTRLLEQTIALVETKKGSLSLEDKVDLGRFHQTWGQIEKLVKIARAQIKERVIAGEIIERPDGKVLTIQIVKPYETVSMTSIREELGSKAEKEIDRLRKLGVVRTIEPEPHLVAK